MMDMGRSSAVSEKKVTPWEIWIKKKNWSIMVYHRHQIYEWISKCICMYIWRNDPWNWESILCNRWTARSTRVDKQKERTRKTIQYIFRCTIIRKWTQTTQKISCIKWDGETN